MGLHKILKIVAAILGIIGVVLAAIVWTLDGDVLIGELKAANGDVRDVDVPGSLANIINLAFVVLGIVLVLITIFVLKGLFAGNAKRTLIGVGLFALVIVISYVMASSEGPAQIGDAVVKNLKDTDKFQNLTADEVKSVTASTIKWAGTSLNAFYILGITALGLMTVMGAKKLIK